MSVSVSPLPRAFLSLSRSLALSLSLFQFLYLALSLLVWVSAQKMTSVFSHNVQHAKVILHSRHDFFALITLLVEAERGYLFWTTAAGYRINLDGLIEGLLTMYTIKTFDTTAGHQHWVKAAPHHMVTVNKRFKKTIYMAYDNIAGRRLAISRAGDGLKQLVLFIGGDYRKGLAFAEHHGCEIVIS
ncbi:hypothetical protein BCR39DRAFT_583310 [Naematelia encephala]|uniref:Uncharacterized protein n=1 Tax=Naematelia encephala TaxID=71784 RepID=A0A1Y2BDH0_9TREE|nr:hypothetical protein BCR39DRAFT_583310 [Naematelia encephala]